MSASDLPREWWLPCPCCDEPAVPPKRAATEQDLEEIEDVEVGDPIWFNDQRARCECGCSLGVDVYDGVSRATADCVEGGEGALAVCPCHECREACEERGQTDG